MTLKSIPTEYKGIRFRSKLESYWAKWFDRYNINWIYEVEGVDLNGLWYLPDFWLPDCRTFFECKGVWRDIDLDKIRELWKVCAPRNIDIVVGQSIYQFGETILVFGMVSPSYGMRKWNDYSDSDQDFITIEFSYWIRLAVCWECKKPYFLDCLGLWICSHCGRCGKHYDGEGTMTQKSEDLVMVKDIKIPLNNSIGNFVLSDKDEKVSSE